MALWVGVGTVACLSVYYLATMKKANTLQKNRMEQIQKRLAEIEEGEASAEEESQ